MGTLRGKISFPGSLHGTLSGLEMIQGYSAFEVAVINGFEGTQEEWLAALKGDKGDTGKGFNILGTYPTLEALSEAVTNPEQGDGYNVGTSAPYNFYTYDAKLGWIDQGKLQGQSGSTFTPSMDSDGNLSWSNDGGLPNPETVRIVGKDGYTPVKGKDYLTDADKSELAEAAASLVDIPEGFSGDYNDLTNKPTLFSGSYNDLTNKPTIPSAYTHPDSHPASMITGLASVATSGSYNDLSNKPTIPAAYSHPSTHAASMISAGTFAGQVVANASGQSHGVFCLRNSKLSTLEETPTVNGQIVWVYE